MTNQYLHKILSGIYSTHSDNPFPVNKINTMPKMLVTQDHLDYLLYEGFLEIVSNPDNFVNQQKDNVLNGIKNLPTYILKLNKNKYLKFMLKHEEIQKVYNTMNSLSLYSINEMKYKINQNSFPVIFLVIVNLIISLFLLCK